jgi:hypothetical protein
MLKMDGRPKSGRCGGYVYLHAQGEASLAPVCRSQRSAHAAAAALADGFRRSLEGLEPEYAADGGAAGRLAHAGGESPEPSPPGSVGSADCATVFRWSQLRQGAAWFGDPVGTAQARGEERKEQKAQYRIFPASPATPESSTIHMGDSPGLRRACAVPAPCMQRVCKESKWQADVLASRAFPEIYAIHMGPPPDQHQSGTSAVPVRCRWETGHARGTGKIGSLNLLSRLGEVRRNAHRRKMWRGG